MSEEKNYKEKLMEMYVKGELPVLKRNEKFNFACVQCGECCRNRGDILLNPFDVFRLCREKKMSLQDFIEKYCEFYTGNSSKLPLMRIQFRPVYELNGVVTGTRCPFLGQTKGLYHCRVHKAKPFVCFSYPLGRIQEIGKETEYLLQDDGTCKGAVKAREEKIMQVVEDWMGGKEKLDREERFNALHSYFLENYRKWINVDKLSENKKAFPIYKKWVAIVAELLYSNYDFTSDDDGFLEQFKTNIDAIQTISEAVVKEFAKLIDLRPKS